MQHHTQELELLLTPTLLWFPLRWWVSIVINSCIVFKPSWICPQMYWAACLEKGKQQLVT